MWWFLLLACNPSETALTEADLVEPAAWRVVPRADDPWADSGADPILCEGDPLRVEPGGAEIDTTACNHATIAQPALLDLRPGDRIRVEIHHFDLVARRPSEAVIALLIGDTSSEISVPIPSEADRFEHHVDVKDASPAGASLYVHVHNHGYNNYVFEDVVRERDE